ncbi:UNVERIFIED_CONTAM: hypothetical protein GTU68_021129 [Idotea baltica]|nr:hypothetical protein [Idotea baltica]
MLPRALLIAAITFLIDQFTKWYVVWHLDLINLRAIDVLPPVLNFRMGWNEGINFGLMSGLSARWFLVILALGISIAVLIWARQFTGWLAASLVGLIVGGALGNALDRVVHGAVADFLNMSCCGFYNPYSFNVADIWVFAGAIGLIIFGERLPKRA